MKRVKIAEGYTISNPNYSKFSLFPNKVLKILFIPQAYIKKNNNYEFSAIFIWNEEISSIQLINKNEKLLTADLPSYVEEQIILDTLYRLRWSVPYFSNALNVTHFDDIFWIPHSEQPLIQYHHKSLLQYSYKTPAQSTHQKHNIIYTYIVQSNVSNLIIPSQLQY